MHWLRLVSRALFVPAIALIAACTSGDDSAPTGGGVQPGTQPPIPKLEAGAPCVTDNDCLAGLACLFPATTCEAFAVCVAAPPATCPSPQAACSCLGEPIQVCDGYAYDPILALGPCGDGGPVFIPDAGLTDSAPTDATVDSASDSAATDASDAAD